jgi:Tfp pilus assembly protein PilF
VWPSAFVAALFAIHPLHVESVVWISERKDLVSGVFFMLTLLAYGLYAKRGGPLAYVAVVLCFALGLMAKPMLVTLPFVLLLLDYWPLRRTGEPEGTEGLSPLTWTASRTCILEKIPLFLLSAVSATITCIVSSHSGAMKSILKYPLPVRLENAAVAVVLYLHKMVWPRGLAPIYPHPGESLPLWHAALALIMILAVSTAALMLARCAPYFIVGWLWFLGMLVPVIGLVQVGDQAMADRYTYLPLIGLFIAIAWGAPALLARPTLTSAHRVTLAIGAVALLLALSATAFLQVQNWSSRETLWNHTLSVTENNYDAHNNLGSFLIEEGREDEAMEHMRKIVLIKPDHNRAHYNLAVYAEKRGELDDAIKHYKAVIEQQPDHAKAHNNLGNILATRGQTTLAIEHYEAALATLSAELNDETKRARALVRFNLGAALIKLGRIDEAKPHLSRTLELDPAFKKARTMLEGLHGQDPGTE